MYLRYFFCVERLAIWVFRRPRLLSPLPCVSLLSMFVPVCLMTSTYSNGMEEVVSSGMYRFVPLYILMAIYEVTTHAQKICAVFSFRKGVHFLVFILPNVSFAEQVRSKSLRDPSAHGNSSLPSCVTSCCLNCVTRTIGGRKVLKVHAIRNEHIA